MTDLLQCGSVCVELEILEDVERRDKKSACQSNSLEGTTQYYYTKLCLQAYCFISFAMAFPIIFMLYKQTLLCLI